MRVGKTVNAIYQIKNGVLKVTANDPGSANPPAAFDAPKARQLIFKMEKPSQIETNANAKTIATTSPLTAPAARATGGAVDESFWEMKADNLDGATEAVRIRPTRYPDKNQRMGGGDGKVIAYGMPFVGLLNEAYAFPIPRMILPANIPTDQFDLMLTLRSHKKEGLQKAIQDQFGFTARRETREKDVLVLKVKNPRLLADHASKRRSNMDYKSGKGLVAYANFPISDEMDFLQIYFGKPIIVEPGLSGNYDFTFQWKDVEGMRQDLSNELARAGLELAPTNMPIDMLVVEKANSASPQAGSAAFQGDLAAFQVDSTAFRGDLAALQGAWVGHENVDNTEDSASLVFSGTNLEFRSVDRENDCYKATFSLREDTNPKQLIAVITESLNTLDVGRPVIAIYRIKDDALTMTEGSTAMPETFDAPDARQLIFKKEKPLQITTNANAKTIAMTSPSTAPAGGTTATAIDESFWELKKDNLEKAPPVLIIRPTRFPHHSGVVFDSPYRFIRHDVDFPSLLATAYSIQIQRMVLPANVPTNRFDAMLTLPSHQEEAQQKAIEKQFGFTARRETRATEVLLLKIKDPGLLALHASKSGGKPDFKHGDDLSAYSNSSIDSYAGILQHLLNKPVVVEPGLSGNYDMTFQWKNKKGAQALYDGIAEAGLELVLTNMPMTMLVVKKTQ
jgi:uncharacterized protein (TIGR03435 family)